MPQFNPNEEKVAVAIFPIKPAGLECSAELWLASGMAKVATSGQIPFVATGLDQSIALPITMPDAGGTYKVYLAVFVEDMLIAAYQAIEDVVIGVSFVGFSLRLTGTWGPLWFARINNWTLSESLPWVTSPAPGWSSIKVWCFNSDFSSPLDPDGLGKEFTCKLEDGHNYILDVSQGNIGDSIAVELQEDPDPPDYPTEPVDVPIITGFKLPDGPVKDTVHAEVSAYLPQEYLGGPMVYSLRLELKDPQNVFSGIDIAGASFVTSEWFERANRWAGVGAQVCLEIPSNGQVHVPGVWNGSEKKFEDVPLTYQAPGPGSGVTTVIPPGRYPVIATIHYWRCADDGEGGMVYALPSGTLDFGIIGVVQVVGTVLTNFRVEGVSEGQTPVGTEVTWAARVTNPSDTAVTETVVLKAWKDENWETPAVNRSKTVTLEPGEGKKVGFSKVMNTVGVWDYIYGTRLIPDLFEGEFWVIE